MKEAQLAELTEWVPIVVSYQNATPTVDWCHLDGQRFTDPFFEETIHRCFADPFNLLFQRRTSMETLGELYRQQPGLYPNGFIFHVSRCGSTLISRLFGTLPQTVVLSEAGPLDTILRAADFLPSLYRERHIAYLRWIISALGQRRHETERALLIKFDAWNLLDFFLLREAFPDVPWLILTREPVEVLVSHSRAAGSQMIPGVIPASLLGMTAEQIRVMPTDEYGARVLGSFYRAASDCAPYDNGLILDYRQLPSAIWTQLPAYFGISCSRDDLAGMQNAARFHAKSPEQEFQADAAEKQNSATERMRQLAQTWIDSWYTQ